jgi:hypothetical protein
MDLDCRVLETLEDCLRTIHDEKRMLETMVGDAVVQIAVTFSIHFRPISNSIIFLRLSPKRRWTSTQKQSNSNPHSFILSYHFILHILSLTSLSFEHLIFITKEHTRQKAYREI